MEIWYSVTGDLDKREAQAAIKWISEEIYSKPVTFLRFLLASGNGDISSGINLYMYLKALPIEVETIAFGEIDTAAAVAYLAGKKRGVVEGCRFLFREGRYTIQEVTAPVRVHEEAIAIFKRELHEVIYIIARETGNDTEVVANMLRKSKIMHVEEAKEFGLVHDILATLPLYQQEKIGFRQP